MTSSSTAHAPVLIDSTSNNPKSVAAFIDTPRLV
jgi:hypothetical protein